MSDELDLLESTVTRLFADVGRSGSPDADEAPFDAALWSELESLDLAALMVPEPDGGGGSFVEARVVARACGQYAVRIPLVETSLAARWLCLAGLERPTGPLSIAASPQGEISGSGSASRFDGCLAGVPWGSRASAIVFIGGEGSETRLGCVEPAAAREVIARSNAAGEPRETLLFEAAEIRSATIDAGSADRLFDELTLLRTAQMSGALAAALERSVRHASSRVQFGRPLSKFQAVQHQLARMASELAAVDCATSAAARAATLDHAPFEIASARLRANQASDLGAAVAHQVHGAIGFTRELDLRLFTQRLVAWRSELGNDAWWADRLGREVTARGADSFWTDLTERADRVALGARGPVSG